MKGLSLNRGTGQLLRHALGYAYRGWPVLPIVRRGKRPLTKTGLLEASTDPDQISYWWTKWPDANIGLRTGVAFDVLDIDGDEGVVSVTAKTGSVILPTGPVSRTGKGQHWLFLPGNTANRTALLPSVDWRGTNGYIIAPPSRHPLGHYYEWLDGHGADSAIPPAPDWLTEYLIPWLDKAPYKPPERVVIATNPHQSKNPQKFFAINHDNPAFSLIDIVQLAVAKGWQPRADGGGRYVIACPFHEGDNEPSMKLYPHDNSFHCFGCDAHGTAADLILNLRV